MEDFKPDFGVALVEAGKHGETIVFNRVELLMLARAGDGDYTSTINICLDQDFAATFEFDNARFEQLLKLLPPEGAKQVAIALGGRFRQPQVLNIPPGAITVRMEAKLGEPRVNPDETYVPLIVQSFHKSKGMPSILFEDDTMITGKLELVAGSAGPVHNVAGVELKHGDHIEVWLNTEDDWVRGMYHNSPFNGELAGLVTEDTGNRPFFLGAKVRLKKRPQ